MLSARLASIQGAEWGSGLTSTADNTLRRKHTICAGDPNGNDAFDPAVEWDGYAIDSFAGLGVHTASCSGDQAPAVSSTDPANGATGVPLDQGVTVTFSEAVDVAVGWFSLACSLSGTHLGTASGGPVTFSIDPISGFLAGGCLHIDDLCRQCDRPGHDRSTG